MTMNNLTVDGEFRYIVQWFNEWSELQRDDFVAILVNYITGAQVNDDDDNCGITASVAAATPVNMNGLPNDIEFNGRPMSLFQCRIKLFNQWNRKWPAELKEKLQQKITEIDGKVGEKITLTLKSKNSESLINGHSSRDQHSFDVLKLNANECLEAELNNRNPTQIMSANDSTVEVLKNETYVDDIEENKDINSSVEQQLLNNINTTTTAATTLHAGIYNNIDNVVVSDSNDNCSNTRHNHAINEREEPVEQVVRMQNLQIKEENEEVKQDNEDVIATTMEYTQQQQSPVTVTVNPVVKQTINTSAEVPLVV